MVQRFFSLLFVISTLFIASAAQAENLFEGYSKVIISGEHSGYVISRYDFDSKKNQFQSIYFLKTGKGASEITESLKATASADLTPISYEYTSVIGKETKTIDASFKNGSMSAVIKTNGKVSKVEKKIPKGTFLSTFLVYLMLKSKEGLKSESKYEYQAIAEEDASIEKGQALVGKEEIFNGYKAFKILNTFKDSKFLSYVNDRGEVLGTNVMTQSISTEIVANSEDATKGQPLNGPLLTAIFGSIPKGTNNMAARGSTGGKALGPGEKPSGKFEGVPQGEGILIKTGIDKSKKQEKGH